MRFRLFGQPQKELCMPSADFVRTFGFLELFDCEFADRLQHPEPLSRMPKQALVDERLDGVDICVGNLVYRLQRRATGEHGEPAEQRLLVVRKEVVAPFDRSTE